ncbi:MAG: ABC transporter permease subunit [Alphaproteobacteria bacterium]|jgi:polar amino acid transport system substrate-binding protein|nr:ABC transporter permease subunit [Alphaproteobacteria bacterium]
MIRVLPLLFAVLLSALPAFGQEKLLRWGGDANSGAPYVFQDPDKPGHIIGVEVDIANAIAEAMGRQPRFVQNEWGSLVPGLEIGLYDAVINGLEITPERAAAVDFSVPYWITHAQFAIRRGDPPIDDLAAARGKTVGTLKASQAEMLLTRAGGITVRTYDQEINAYDDLRNGRIDAVLLDAPIGVYYAGPDRALQLVGRPVGRIEYGVAVKKGNAALLAEINQAIATIRQSGKLREILDRWNLWSPVMADVTGDKRPMTAQPTAFDAYVAATRPQGWEARLMRYVAFLPAIGKAAITTIEISLISMALAIALGAMLALARVYGGTLLDRLALLYIETVRGTPLLIQILFIYYGLPNIGVKLDPFLAGVLALGFNYAAYEAENYRAGLLAVPRQQYEAAVALNMTERQALRHVVIPQAIRLVLPPTTNDFISLLKDSSLVSVITMVELTQTYVQLSTTYYDYFGTGILIGLVYLLIGLPFVRLARWTEARLHRAYRRGG